MQLDSKWRSVLPLNESHFLCSPSVQTTVFPVCLRSLKSPLLFLLDHSGGMMKEKQLPLYCHLPSVSVLRPSSSVEVAFVSEKPVSVKRERL